MRMADKIVEGKRKKRCYSNKLLIKAMVRWYPTIITRTYWECHCICNHRSLNTLQKFQLYEVVVAIKVKYKSNLNSTWRRGRWSCETDVWAEEADRLGQVSFTIALVTIVTIITIITIISIITIITITITITIVTIICGRLKPADSWCLQQIKSLVLTTIINYHNYKLVVASSEFGRLRPADSSADHITCSHHNYNSNQIIILTTIINYHQLVVRI